MAGHVQFGYQIGFTLVQVDGAGVYLKKGYAAFHSFQQRAGGSVNNFKLLPTGSPDIDILGGISNSRGKVPLAVAFP